MRLLLSLLVCAHFLLPTTTRAAIIVFDNGIGGASGIVEAGVSDVSANPINIQADDVILQVDTNVTGIQWTGLFNDLTSDDDFTIDIYEDNAGVPLGLPLASFDIDNNANPMDSGVNLGLSSTPVLNYSADIDFNMTANTRYWIAIYNDTPQTNVNFGWGRELPGGFFETAVFFNNSWRRSTGNFDFRLTSSVPEPSVTLISSFTLACFVNRRRRANTIG
ncbi:MAG: hypothetical protein AAF664_09280 [Planctomycetota bacterium]